MKHSLLPKTSNWNYKNLFFVVVLLLSSIHVSAQIFDPVKWNFETKKISNDEVELQFIAKIEPHWHMYSQEKVENGPVSTYFEIKKNNNFELIGKVTEPKPIEEFDKNFGIVVKYFADKVVFKQKIKVKSDKPFNIEGFLEFMCCDDKQCLPPNDVEFSFPINGGVSEAAISASENQDQLTSPDTKKANNSLWKIIIEAIIWGFVALLTPCVFPMIPMTVSFFMKGSENKIKSRINAMTYGFSIVLLYTLPIAIIILLTYFLGGKSVTGDIFNWLSTHWLPNILFFLIFMIFAASFFGAFEIVIPSRWTNSADSKADKGGMLGAFFMALVLVLVSFSCTGPIVGTVIVKSTQGEFWEPIVTMLAFSTAFALPFTLFAFFPSWLQKLPKSGGWLNSVKVVLGFIEIALGFKFLGVADQTYHWGLLDREVYLAIWIVTFTLLGFYLLGKLKFKLDSEVKHVSAGRVGLAIIVFTFVVYMIPGMWGAPLKALSGYMPPLQTHDFDLNAIVRNNLKVASFSGGSSDQMTKCERPKYGDFLHLPHGLEGYFDYEQAMNCAKELNKPLFIDFTGHGCVNCREMEANVWSDPRVLKKLSEDFVVVALYVDDKTALDKEEWVKSTYDGKWKKSIGKKNANFQIQRYGTNAQPYYVLLDHNEKILATPRAYDLDVDGFIKFLDKGLENFKK